MVRVLMMVLPWLMMHVDELVTYLKRRNREGQRIGRYGEEE